MAISSLMRKWPGEIVFAEGDAADSVYEVVAGMVRRFKLLPDGRRQITGFPTAGRFLGLAPGAVCTDAADAVTEITLCHYTRAAFERLAGEVPDFAQRVLSVAALELQEAQNQLLLLGRKTAVEKMASFLVLLADRGADAVDLPMTRGDIADYLGLTVETVSRTLTELRRKGLIALPSPNRVELHDRARLAALAWHTAAESAA
jgi:CRP/FNR family transcriptional regulator